MESFGGCHLSKKVRIAQKYIYMLNRHTTKTAGSSIKTMSKSVTNGSTAYKYRFFKVSKRKWFWQKGNNNQWISNKRLRLS